MSRALLAEICNAPAVSGWEDEVRKIVRREIEPHVDDLSVDRLGNLIARKGSSTPGTKSPGKVMVSAHMDEIGFMVKYIDDEGYLRLQPLGGFDTRVLMSQRVIVHGREPVKAVIPPPARFITDDAARHKAPKMEELIVDVGRPVDEVKSLIRIGDYITFDADFAELNDKTVVARNFDDRLGVYVLVEMVKRLGEIGVELYAVGSTQEELGVRGAQTAAYQVDPDIGVALDGSVSSPDPFASPDLRYTRPGDGVGIYRFDKLTVSDRPVFDTMVACAEASSIPYQITMWGGTDASAMQRVRSGAQVCTLGIPTRYMHSTVQLAHWDDIEGNIELMLKFLERAHEIDMELPS